MWSRFRISTVKWKADKYESGLSRPDSVCVADGDEGLAEDWNGDGDAEREYPLPVILRSRSDAIDDDILSLSDAEPLDPKNPEPTRFGYSGV